MSYRRSVIVADAITSAMNEMGAFPNRGWYPRPKEPQAPSQHDRDRIAKAEAKRKRRQEKHREKPTTRDGGDVE